MASRRSAPMRSQGKPGTYHD